MINSSPTSLTVPKMVCEIAMRAKWTYPFLFSIVVMSIQCAVWETRGGSLSKITSMRKFSKVDHAKTLNWNQKESSFIGPLSVQLANFVLESYLKRYERNLSFRRMALARNVKFCLYRFRYWKILYFRVLDCTKYTGNVSMCVWINVLQQISYIIQQFVEKK